MVSLVLATAASLAPPYLAKLAIDDGIGARDLEALNWIVAAFVLSALVYWGATYLQTYLVGWVGQRALQDLRLRIFTHLQRQSIGFFSRRKTGVLISRLTNDVQALDQLVTDGIVTLFSSTLTLVGHGRDPAAARRAARARHLPRDVPGARDRKHPLQVPRRGRVQGGAGADRKRDRLPAGDPLGRADRAVVRPGAAPRRAVRGAERRAPRRQLPHRAAERRVLPRRRARCPRSAPR